VLLASADSHAAPWPREMSVPKAPSLAALGRSAGAVGVFFYILLGNPTAVNENEDSNRPQQTLIYRKGNYTNKNFTPRPGKDIDGLSFSLTVPEGNYIVTTMEMVNETIVLEAINDRPGHVSVRPRNPLELQEWAATRIMLDTNPVSFNHPYTILLKSITLPVRR